MKTVWILLIFALVACGCQTPYSGTLGPGDFKGWIEDEGPDYVCLWNGFDRMCIQTIPGRDGRDGRDGKDGISPEVIDTLDGAKITDAHGNTVIIRDGEAGRDGENAETVYYVLPIKEVVETIVYEVLPPETPEPAKQQIVERVVTEYITEIKEVPVPVEVPVEVFITEIVEITREIGKEIEVKVIEYVEVPKIVKEISYVYDGCTPFYQHLPEDEQPCDVKG